MAKVREDLSVAPSEQTFVNCLFTGNNASLGSGGADYVSESVMSITNCTIAGNDADTSGTIDSFNSDTIVTNTIVWNNAANQLSQSGEGITKVSFSNIDGGLPGNLGNITDGGANINADPLLEDVSGGDLRLSAGSPSIDAGDNDAPGLVGVTTDLDGNPRFMDGTASGVATVDMGAYELQVEVASCPGDLSGPQGQPDGTVDVFDLIELINNWGPCADSNNCPADLSGPVGEPDGAVDVFDLIELINNWGPCPSN